MKNFMRLGVVVLLFGTGLACLFAKNNNIVHAELSSEGKDAETTDVFAVLDSFSIMINIASFFNGYDIRCFGESNGAVMVSVTGGNEVSYVWTDGSQNLGTDQNLEGLPAGTYFVHVTNVCPNGESSTLSDSITLIQPNELLVNITEQTDASCGQNGAVSIDVTGGAGNSWVAWSDNTIGNVTNVSDLAAGTYMVTATDANGCTATQTVIIAGVELVGEILSPASCHDSADGAATVIVNGNEVPPYTYTWNGIPGNNTQTNLLPGANEVIITDGNQCAVSITINIPAPNPLGGGGMILEAPNCHNSADGSAIVSAGGGTLPYTFSWLNGETGEQANALSPGEHVVTLTDANGCTLAIPVFVPSPPAITIISTITDVNCFGESNGNVEIIPAGGNGGFSFIWSNGRTQAEESNLGAGTYTVTVMDADNCSETIEVVVGFPEPLIANIVDAFATDCPGSVDGKATVVSEGGNGGIGTQTYLWENGETGQSAIGLSSGSHMVTVSDIKGCTAVAAVVIAEPEPITADISVSNIPCVDGGVGELDAVVAGGTSPYNLLWPGGQTGEFAVYTTPGIYNVSVTDANNCTQMVSAVLPLNSISGVTEYPDFAVFQDNEVQGLNYVSGIPTMTWQLLESRNIDVEDPGFVSGGLAENPLELGFVLEEKRSPGYVLLEVYPQGGLCIGDTVQTVINVVPGKIPVFAPEIFSPNDDGVNDTWEVLFPPADDPGNYSVVVFGRNGQKVYEANTMDNPWQGDGCPDGAYYYIIKNKLAGEKYRGAVSILR